MLGQESSLSSSTVGLFSCLRGSVHEFIFATRGRMITIRSAPESLGPFSCIFSGHRMLENGKQPSEREVITQLYNIQKKIKSFMILVWGKIWKIISLLSRWGLLWFYYYETHLVSQNQRGRLRNTFGLLMQTHPGQGWIDEVGYLGQATGSRAAGQRKEVMPQTVDAQTYHPPGW